MSERSGPGRRCNRTGSPGVLPTVNNDALGATAMDSSATTARPRRHRRRFLIGGVVAAAAVMITGGALMSAGGDDADIEHIDKAAQTVTYSAGDVAACVGYARVDDRIREDTAAIQNEEKKMPIFLYAAVLQRDADQLRDSMVAANGAEIVAARDATMAGFGSAVATVKDYTKGTLDLSADLTAIYVGSKTLATLCDEANASTTHLPLIEP